MELTSDSRGIRSVWSGPTLSLILTSICSTVAGVKEPMFGPNVDSTFTLIRVLRSPTRGDSIISKMRTSKTVARSLKVLWSTWTNVRTTPRKRESLRLRIWTGRSSLVTGKQRQPDTSTTDVELGLSGVFRSPMTDNGKKGKGGPHNLYLG